MSISFTAKRQVFDELDLKPIEVCKCHRERLNNFSGHHCKKLWTSVLAKQLLIIAKVASRARALLRAQLPRRISLEPRIFIFLIDATLARAELRRSVLPGIVSEPPLGSRQPMLRVVQRVPFASVSSDVFLSASVTAHPVNTQTSSYIPHAIQPLLLLPVEDSSLGADNSANAQRALFGALVGQLCDEV